MAQALATRAAPQLADEAFHALVAAGEVVVVDQILVDGLGVAALAEGDLDEVTVGLAGAGRGAAAGHGNRVRVGGHLAGFVGRFWAHADVTVGGHLIGRF